LNYYKNTKKTNNRKLH